MNRIRWYGPTLVVLLTVILVMISGPRLIRNIVFAQEQTEIKLVSDSLEQSELLVQISNAFRKVSDVVRPSVVSIHTYSKVRKTAARSSLEDLRRRLPDWFRNEFDHPDREEGQDESDQDDYEQYDQPSTQFTGSGWVYDIDGHIVTNYHVIKNADEIEVHFANGDERVATVVGSDPDTDVAVLKVNGDHLHPAKIAKEPVQQGDIVFAFGSPLRFEFSVSQGVVSALERELNIVGRRSVMGHLIPGYENFIQTDAAINQGNSGGPLTNIFGQVVGMNTAIAVRGHFGQGFVGIGFAIPTDMVGDVVEKILKHGKVERGYLGVFFDELDPKRAATFGYQGSGVVVTDAIEDGPASEAGIANDDIIAKIDGVDINSGKQLRSLVAHITPGTEINVEVVRNGQTLVVPVLLKAKPNDVLARHSHSEMYSPGAKSLLRKVGIMSAKTFTQDQAKKLDVPFSPGVLVGRVRAGSNAYQARLRPGQIIVAVNTQGTANHRELAEAFSAYEGDELVRLTIIDHVGRRRFCWIEMPRQNR